MCVLALLSKSYRPAHSVASSFFGFSGVDILVVQLDDNVNQNKKLQLINGVFYTLGEGGGATRQIK